MQDDEIKPDDFYKLFQYNPETNEYIKNIKNIES